MVEDVSEVVADVRESSNVPHPLFQNQKFGIQNLTRNAKTCGNAVH